MFFDNIFLTALLWSGLFAAEIFETYLILKISQKDSFMIKREVYYATYLVDICAVLVCIFLRISFKTVENIHVYILLASLFLAINDSFFNRIGTIITIVLFEITMDAIPLYILRYKWNFNDEINSLIVALLVIPFLLLIYHIRYHSQLFNQFLNKSSTRLIKYILIISAFLQWEAASTLIQVNPQNLFISSISFIFVLLLCSLTLYILNMHKRMIEMSAEQEELLTTQKEYYLTLLEKEEETRRYRHDMNNHLMCLTALLDKDSTDDIRDYLSDLQNEFKSVNDTVYQTGNTILTAITAHYIPMVDENTKVTITGRLTKDLQLSNTELCSVYSNLLKNSIEELQRIGESVHKELSIRFDNGKNFGKIFISNSMKDPSSFRGLASKTTKDDKKNHGFGIQNINRIVSKHSGTFTIKKDNNQFCCEVVLPILSAKAG